MNCETIPFPVVAGKTTKFSFGSSLFWQFISAVCRCTIFGKQSNVVSRFGIYCWKKTHTRLCSTLDLLEMSLIKKRRKMTSFLLLL